MWAIQSLLWYWPNSTTEQIKQTYCSDVGEWLWWADAMELYTQGPQTGKRCKLKDQSFHCCLVYWNSMYTKRVTYSQSFHIFHKQQYKFVTKMAQKCTPAVTSERSAIPSLYMKSSILEMTFSNAHYMYYAFSNVPVCIHMHVFVHVLHMVTIMITHTDEWQCLLWPWVQPGSCVL